MNILQKAVSVAVLVGMSSVALADPFGSDNSIDSSTTTTTENTNDSNNNNVTAETMNVEIGSGDAYGGTMNGGDNIGGDNTATNFGGTQIGGTVNGGDTTNKISGNNNGGQGGTAYGGKGGSGGKGGESDANSESNSEGGLGVGVAVVNNADKNNNKSEANSDQANSQSTSFSSTYKEAVNTAYAPSVQVGGQDMCRSGVGAGGQGGAFGISLGGTVVDRNCEMLKLSREVAITLGDKETAKALLCQDDRVAQAYASAGKPCNVVVEAKGTYKAPAVVASTNPMGIR
jgi:hypothetical protein